MFKLLLLTSLNYFKSDFKRSELKAPVEDPLHLAPVAHLRHGPQQREERRVCLLWQGFEGLEGQGSEGSGARHLQQLQQQRRAAAELRRFHPPPHAAGELGVAQAAAAAQEQAVGLGMHLR